MDQLFARLSTQWSKQQTSSIITQNNFIATQSIMTEEKRLRISTPIKSLKYYTNTSIFSRFLSPLRIFKCQLCSRKFTTKDSYLDHMIVCSVEHQASIKI
ncbi:unnamed protein product, partial [Rotaria sp. Silwood1]